MESVTAFSSIFLVDHVSLIQEVHKMVNKHSKEFKGLISIIEVSAANNINIEPAFMFLVSLIGKSAILFYTPFPAPSLLYPSVYTSYNSGEAPSICICLIKQFSCGSMSCYQLLINGLEQHVRIYLSSVPRRIIELYTDIQYDTRLCLYYQM